MSRAASAAASIGYRQTEVALRQGSAPQEIYLAVGIALSWWEGSEDVLMGVFHWLCAKAEPTAFETYVTSSRGNRGKMLLAALKRYQSRFLPDELNEIRSALKVLDKLAPVRNEIAHGHVAENTRTEDGVVVMAGSFLMPSLNEGGWHERSYRYAHTAVEIDDWREKVRTQRARIMDASFAARIREQEAHQALDMSVKMTISIAEAITERRVSPDKFELVRKT